MSVSESDTLLAELSRLVKSKAGHLSDLRRKQRSVEEVLRDGLGREEVKQKFRDYEESFKKFMSVHEEYIESEVDENKRRQAVCTYDLEKDKRLNLQIALDKYEQVEAKGGRKSVQSLVSESRSRGSSRSSTSSLKRVAAARLKLKALKEKQELLRSQAEIRERIDLIDAETELKIAEECVVIDEGIDNNILGPHDDVGYQEHFDGEEVVRETIIDNGYGNLSPPKVSCTSTSMGVIKHSSTQDNISYPYAQLSNLHLSETHVSSFHDPMPHRVSFSGIGSSCSPPPQGVYPPTQSLPTTENKGTFHSSFESGFMLNTSPIMSSRAIQSAGHASNSGHAWLPYHSLGDNHALGSGGSGLSLGVNQRVHNSPDQVDPLQVIADAIRQGPTLPKVELLKFDGNPREYIEFLTNFRNNIESQVTGDSNRLTRLIGQCTGKAKEAIRSCVNLPAKEGYVTAQKILHDNFGRPHMVAEAHMNRLKELRLKSIDASSLMSFTRTLEDVWRALSSMGELYSNRLDNEETLRILMRKLPAESLKRKWADKAGGIILEKGCVKFADFIEFTSRLGTRLNNVFGEELKVYSSKESLVKSNKMQHSAKITTLANSALQETAKRKFPPCVKCKGAHGIWKCPEFKGDTYSDRMKDVKSLKLCFVCLGEGHLSKQCKRGFKCRIEGCGGDHHTLIHPPKREQGKVNNQLTTNMLNAEESDQAENTEDSEIPMVSCNRIKVEDNTERRARICFKVVPVKVRDPQGLREIKTYAFLDSGSDVTLCLEDIPERLSVPGERKIFEMETTNGVSKFSGKEVHIQVAPLNGKEWFECRRVVTTKKIPVGSRHFATNHDVKKWPHLKDLTLPEIGHKEVTILIGNDHPEIIETPVELRKGNVGEPVGVKTPLGWTVCGPVGDTTDKEISVNFSQTKENQELSKKLQQIYDAEFGGSLSVDIRALSIEDQRAKEIMINTVCLKGGHYHVGLPFKQKFSNIPDSLPVARKRLTYLKRKFEKDNNFKEKYSNVMAEYIKEGSARIVPDSEVENMGPHWYLPHHAVWHPRKPETPRVVFDCAAKANGVSLNDMLLKGPENTSSLVGVLLRFRAGKIGVAADIKRMFHQVFVKEQDRAALCYLWWPNGDVLQEPKTHQMLVHIFGATSSPSVCGFALRQTSTDNQEEFSYKACDAVLNNFYVDDFLCGFEDEQEAISTIDELRRLLVKGGFNLTKFLSSSRNVLETIPTEHRATAVKDLDLQQQNLPTERALGVQWDVQKDRLSYVVAEKKFAETRRGMLSSIASVYDPLGIASPLLLPGRELNQHLCRLNYGWDDRLPDDILDRWKQWKTEISNLHGFGVQRCYVPVGFGQVESVELHHFSDASEQHGYGTASYLRFINTKGEKHCCFVFGKSRVRPLRSGITVPKLELTAAAVLVSINSMLLRELSVCLNISRVTFWTDSIIVLKYIRNVDKKFVQFVANRVAQIKEESEVSQWRHVRSQENPADLASRGMRANESKKLDMWMNGPDFLWQDEEAWPSQPSELSESLTEQDEGVKDESKRGRVLVNVIASAEGFWSCLLNRFSSWSCLRRTVAWVRRAVVKWKVKIGKNLQGADEEESNVLSVKELEEAERVVIKAVQDESFKGESLKKGRLAKLQPFHEDDVIKVGGRLSRSDLPYEFKHPAILSSKHHVSDLIISHYHIKNGHSGSQHVLSQLRKKFWIVSGLSAVRRVLSRCHMCKIQNARTGEQLTAPLPHVRVSSDSQGLIYPFSAVSIDMFGPINTSKDRTTRSSRKGPMQKRYGCIFTCLRYRAVHLEMTKDLSTDSFINAVFRFIARRGPPRIIYTDNGSNFKGAEKDVLLALKRLNAEKISKTFADKFITWKFNPPYASHQGGIWERIIRSIRRILHSMLRDNLVDDETLCTFLCEVEKILNDRPITRVSDNPRDAEALSPSQILLLRKNISVSPQILQEKEKYRARWKYITILSNLFWKRWISEYLPTIQERQKWLDIKRNFKCGDFVIIVDKDLPRGQWKKGIIENTFPDSDGIVRRVCIRTACGHLDRDIRKICLLEEDIVRYCEEKANKE